MLRKLLKYEFKATGRLYLPLYLAVLIFAVLGRISINGNVWNVSSAVNAYGGSFSVGPEGHGFLAQVISFLSVLVLVIYFLTILGAFVVHFIITIQRFWKNLMGDEGYLMFTLPVSVDELLWSKAITAFFWTIATGLVVLLSVFLLAFQPWMPERILMELRSIDAGEFQLMLQLLGTIFSAKFWLLCLVAVPVSSIGGTFFLYAAMSIGHTVKNHKVLASVGAYLGISTVTSIASSTITGAMMPLMLRNMDDIPGDLQSRIAYFGSIMNRSIIIGVLISIFLGAAVYLVTRYLLTTQLNLE